MNDNYAALGQNLSIGANADQLEQLAITRGTASVNDALFDEQASGVLGDEATFDVVERDAVATETLAGSTLEHVQERKTLLGDAYPFAITGQALRYCRSRTGVYEFCLDLSLAKLGAGRRQQDIVAFELLAARMVGDTLSGNHYRTGWPSHDPHERPKRFKQLAERLHQSSGEWWWHPAPGNDDDPSPTLVKDEGIDFIAWHRLDTRGGSLFIAGQCACGEDWRNKFSDLTCDRMHRWFMYPCHVPFTRALAIPYIIPGYNAIGDVSRQAGLVFDRIRLTLAAERDPAPQPLRAWIDTQRTRSLPHVG